jgi:DNA-binding MarR family transcriptional regulator
VARNIEDLRLLLSRTSRTASRHYRAKLAQFELSNSQATALLYLDQREGATLRELADALSADLATASALVDRLTSQGLVLRETDPEDRRRARLLLSEAGVELLRPLQEATRQTNQLIVEAIGEQQAAELAAVLERLLAGLNEPTASRKDADET